MQFGHGQSNPTYKVECLPWSDDATAGLLTYVLRKKPPGKILASAHAVEREYAAQRALGGGGRVGWRHLSPRYCCASKLIQSMTAGMILHVTNRVAPGSDATTLRPASAVPVPEMLALCEDASILGTPFYLMSFIPGHIFVAPGLPDLPTPAHRAAVYAEMAAVLGAIHRVDPVSVGLGGYGKPDDYSRRQLERWARQYRASVTTLEAPVVALIEWLRANVPADEPSGRLVHGDFRLDNLVFSSSQGPAGGGGGGVTAVLDWELSTLGAPYSDIAYNCIPYHIPPGGEAAAYPSFTSAQLPPGVPTEREYVAMWSRAAGLPDPMAQGGSWHFYIALSLFRGAAILAGVRARAVAGNAAAANASAAGQVVEILAGRALVVAGVTPNGVPRSVGPAGSAGAGAAAEAAGGAGLTLARTSASSASAGFEPGERAGALLVKLRRFMSDHVYPAEAVMEAHAATPQRWTVCPKVEELKTLAKRAGLWNLWLPADSRELLKLTVPSGEDGELLTGPGLTNLEYAHLAGEMVGLYKLNAVYP
jgi:acyl-CoA dehydrogenase